MSVDRLLGCFFREGGAVYRENVYEDHSHQHFGGNIGKKVYDNSSHEHLEVNIIQKVHEDRSHILFGRNKG